MSDELVTYAEATQRLGLSPHRVASYVSKGWIERADPDKDRGHKALVRLADVLAAIERGKRYLEDRREKREAILATGERSCNLCHRVKPLDAFAPSPNGIGGRHSRCRDCANASERERIQRPDVRARRIAYKRRYRQAHRDQVRAYKRDYQKRVCREKGTPYVNLRDYFRKRYYVLKALDEGKRSPVCRRVGFALVRLGEASTHGVPRYRPVRLDVPIARGETVVAHYGWIAGRWVVLPPPIPTGRAADAELLRRLRQREQRTRSLKTSPPKEVLHV